MPIYKYERLPIVLAADPGTRVSLQSVLDSAFGIGWSFDPGIWIYGQSTASLAYIEPKSGQLISFGFFDPANKVDSHFLRNGAPIALGQSVPLSSLAGVEIAAGNALAPTISIAVSNAYGAGKDPVFTWYSIQVVPTATFSGGTYAATGDDVAAMALRFAQQYATVPLPLDCGWVADAVAASVGAPMPVKNSDVIPSNNNEGGLWRIVHRGDQTPIADWQKLVRPGDIIRLDWIGDLFHTTTVVGAEDSQGRMRVVDNAGPNGEIVARSVNFEPFAIPESVTIFRLSPDGLYLLEGSSNGERLNGTTRADDLRGGGGNDTINGGDGSDTAVFSGNRADYTITRKADGAFTVADKAANRDGTDTISQIEQLQFSDQTLAVWAALPFPDLFAANLSQAKAIASAYQTLLGGIPGISGFDFLIKGNLTSNFGASPSAVFNDENIFINVVNALVQGNAEATSKFNTLAAGTTLSAKITSLYKSIIPVAKQSADGIAFFTRPDGLKFYQDVAKERGMTAENGPAVIALASILKVAVDGKIGIGNPVSDLIASIADGSSGLPAGSATVLPIETIDGTKFDADDASDVLPGFSGLAPAPAPLIGIIADTGVMFTGVMF